MKLIVVFVICIVFLITLPFLYVGIIKRLYLGKIYDRNLVHTEQFYPWYWENDRSFVVIFNGRYNIGPILFYDDEGIKLNKISYHVDPVVIPNCLGKTIGLRCVLDRNEMRSVKTIEIDFSSHGKLFIQPKPQEKE